MNTTYEIFDIPHGKPADYSSILGGYWPAAFSEAMKSGCGRAVSMPIGIGGAGHGGNAHAANEYYVIEGAGKVYGMAGAEKPPRDDHLPPCGEEPAAGRGATKTEH
jgi:hypothetical protein